MQIKSISNNEPHESWGGWENFLATCEVREQADGVTYYGKSNCNYIVFPDGTLVENYGFNGHATMNHVRDEGAEVVLSRIRRNVAHIRRLMQLLQERDYDALNREMELFSCTL